MPALRVGARQVGVVRAPRVAGSGEDQRALLPVHERLGLVEVRAGGPVADGEAVAAAVVGDPEHAPGPAGDLGHVVVPEVVEDLVEGGADRGHARELLDEGVPQVDGFLGHRRVAVLVAGRAGVDVALVVFVLLVEVHGERVHQVVEHVLPGREVDAEVVPLAGRDLRDSALGEGLPGRDDLHHGREIVAEVVLDRRDQRRALHRGQQVREEALLGELERGAGGGLGAGVADVAGVYAGRLERGPEVVVDDLEGPRVLVVDAGLLGGQHVLEDVDLDAGVGQGPGLVPPERLAVPGDHLERGHPARVHRLHEVGPGREGRLGRAPQAEPARVAEAVDRAGAGGRHVHDACLRQGVLQPHAGPSLLAGRDRAARAPAAGGPRQRVRLVEDDHAVPGVARFLVQAAGEPVDDLLEPRRVVAAAGGPQGRVGREQDPRGPVDGVFLPPLVDRCDVARAPAQGRPVALGVLDQLVGRRQPERLAAPLQPAVENDPGDLPPLPQSLFRRRASSRGASGWACST